MIRQPAGRQSRPIDLFIRRSAPGRIRISDDTASCMVLSEAIYVILLTDKYRRFTLRRSPTPRPPSACSACPPSRMSWTIPSAKGAAGGGIVDRARSRSHGFM
jgi:hypothetical protein